MAAASSHNIELEAANLLHKLIQESKDEPSKLANKLFVILQHMKASGKENSMPYQVISRAMETVINQHGFDIEALRSSRFPQSGETQIENPRTQQVTRSSQVGAVNEETKISMTEDEMGKVDSFSLGRLPSGSGLDTGQKSVSHRSGKSIDHESSSGLDTRSGNSLSQERRDTPSWEKKVSQSENKKSRGKRKRTNSSLASESKVDSIPQQLDSLSTVVNPGKGIPMVKLDPSGSFSSHGGAPVKVHGGMSSASSFYPTGEPCFSNPMQFSGSIYDNHGFLSRMHKGTVDPETWKQGFAKGLVTGTSQKTVEDHLISANRGGEASGNIFSGKVLENDAEISNSLTNSDKLPQAVGKSPSFPVMLFKDQHLRQLRAQCLVFLAFRNGIMPKQLHLEIALGNLFPKEDTDGPQKTLSDLKGKVQSLGESICTAEGMPSLGRLFNGREIDRKHPNSCSAGSVLDVDSMSKEADNRKMLENTNHLSSESSVIGEEMQHQFPTKGRLKSEIQAHEVAKSMAFPSTGSQQEISSTRGFPLSNHEDIIDSGRLQVGKINPPLSSVSLDRQVKLGMVNLTGIGSPAREHWKPVPGLDNDHHLIVPGKQANDIVKHVSQDVCKLVPVGDVANKGPVQQKDFEHAEENKSDYNDFVLSPKHTTLDKCIMDQQKRKLLTEQNWMLKQRKTEQRITASFYRLKETVSSCEDISSKTKSVIELKKLQLLKLQRRLRSDFLNDFFKPIVSEMDRLKHFKKNKLSRRLKQVEKYEQKMKEERQKRIRERQKEFFVEVETHKERLDDVFKIKKERWKGFNKYIKEFHKKKERIHREKFDRIQREKINLLKINDVEGYLRMVQDAKSDRVKQLLKETEKYLEKLRCKLQDAKPMSRRNEFEENRSKDVADNGDESDQAKNYLESNEKYYLMAHSIKESIADQPTSLVGGKLREYQMNGLRWLVSLYNNHLNGILADEMGLGKTVQVIALICYLMETKNDRGPFLVVVPSSVLPGWESEINLWAPIVNKIIYSGPPEERRRLFKERIVQQKFNVLLTTYEYLMNKHDRPKLSKVHWHYIIIDEGHRIKNASCKLNAELKYYQSSHRLLLTGTPLQNNLEELWALLNFLLPNIFNSSDDFSQWFNKPFVGACDNSADEALLSEEENLLIINRLHQVLRPFVLRRLKHKVENELPEKIERLVRCEASAYQKLLMKRVEDNLGSIGSTKARSVHNSVVELRNICNHPYLSQLHAEEVDSLVPRHFLPPIIRLCGKLEMLDRLLPKLKATDHRILFFSTMTRLLDVMEEYLSWKQYRYLRLDGQTSGNDRGTLIDQFNRSDSPYFIFLLSIRAGGVGVNLQAADTVIIFDTDWNPQVDLQAQARAHRIGQKRDVLVLRLETVQTVEEQVRASAEHKLGVANQSITAGFFDNNTSAEDRREYLESLLRESKKEEAAPVLDDDALNDILARSESEIDIFESIDKQRHEEEMATWKKLSLGPMVNNSESVPSLPSRLVTSNDLKAFYEAMKIYEVSNDGSLSNVGVKRKSEFVASLDTKKYGRGKRAREVRSYEEQWTEEEFENICQANSPESPNMADEIRVEMNSDVKAEVNVPITDVADVHIADSKPPLPSVMKALPLAPFPLAPPSIELQILSNNLVTPPSKRGRGRPRRITANTQLVVSPPSVTVRTISTIAATSVSDLLSDTMPKSITATIQHPSVSIAPNSHTVLIPPAIGTQSTIIHTSIPVQTKAQTKRTQSLRGKKQNVLTVPVLQATSSLPTDSMIGTRSVQITPVPAPSTVNSTNKTISEIDSTPILSFVAPPGFQPKPLYLVAPQTPIALPGFPANLPCPLPQTPVAPPGFPSNLPRPSLQISVGPPGFLQKPPVTFISMQAQGKGQKEVDGPRRRGRKPGQVSPAISDSTIHQDLKPNEQLQKHADSSTGKVITTRSKAESSARGLKNVVPDQADNAQTSFGVASPDGKSNKKSVGTAGDSQELKNVVQDQVFLIHNSPGSPCQVTISHKQRYNAQIDASHITKSNYKSDDKFEHQMELKSDQEKVSTVHVSAGVETQDIKSNKQSDVKSGDSQELKTFIQEPSPICQIFEGSVIQDTNSNKQSVDIVEDLLEVKNIVHSDFESQDTESNKDPDKSGDALGGKVNDAQVATNFMDVQECEAKVSYSVLTANVCVVTSLEGKDQTVAPEAEETCIDHESRKVQIAVTNTAAPMENKVVPHSCFSETSVNLTSQNPILEKECENMVRDILVCKNTDSTCESHSHEPEGPCQVHTPLFTSTISPNGIDNAAKSIKRDSVLSDVGVIIASPESNAERFHAAVEASQPCSSETTSVAFVFSDAISSHARFGVTSIPSNTENDNQEGQDGDAIKNSPCVYLSGTETFTEVTETKTVKPVVIDSGKLPDLPVIIKDGSNLVKDAMGSAHLVEENALESGETDVIYTSPTFLTDTQANESVKIESENASKLPGPSIQCIEENEAENVDMEAISTVPFIYKPFEALPSEDKVDKPQLSLSRVVASTEMIVTQVVKDTLPGNDETFKGSSGGGPRL